MVVFTDRTIVYRPVVAFTGPWFIYRPVVVFTGAWLYLQACGCIYRCMVVFTGLWLYLQVFYRLDHCLQACGCIYRSMVVFTVLISLRDWRYQFKWNLCIHLFAWQWTYIWFLGLKAWWRLGLGVVIVVCWFVCSTVDRQVGVSNLPCARALWHSLSVVHDWVNRGLGMSNRVGVTGHIKDWAYIRATYRKE